MNQPTQKASLHMPAQDGTIALPWFTSKGQVLQTALAATMAPGLALIAAWPQIRSHKGFSPATVVSCILAVLLLTLIVLATRRFHSLRQSHAREIADLQSRHAGDLAIRDQRLANYSRAEKVFDQIWTLKAGAREIKRRWPNCLFVQAPLDRIRWSPFVGQPETGMGGTELEKAIQWHDAFFAYANNRRDGQYPIHGDFDAVMAMLDRDERAELGLSAQIKNEVTSVR